MQDIRTRSGKETKPAENNVLLYCLRILHLGIQLVLVFDGPKRLHNGGKPHPGYGPPTPLLRETFTRLGILWHESPGEADAECARMEELGIVDAVWSDDGDALAYGCKTLMRSYREIKLSTEKEKETKSSTSFLIFTPEATAAKNPGMDRHGFVLNALLTGGEKGSLPDFTPKDVLRAARNGLAKSLHAASGSKEDFLEWKESKLRTHLNDVHRDVDILKEFPTFAQLEDYTRSLVSNDETFKAITFNEFVLDDHKVMLQFMTKNYQWTLKKFVKWVVPYFLVRSLLATKTGDEHRHDLLDLTCNLKKKPQKAEAEFVLAAATSLDLSSLRQERFTVETLTWILRRARLNRNAPITSYFTTPQSARTSIVGTGITRSAPGGTRPPLFNVTVGGSIQPTSSKRARQKTPPSPTPVRASRPNLISSQVGARTTKNVAPTVLTAENVSAGKGKARADQVPALALEAHISKRVRSPTHEEEQPIKKLKLTVIDPTDSFGSSDTAALPLMTPRISQEEDYGSPPSSQDLQALPYFGDSVAKTVVVFDDSETEGEYGSFPSSPDLQGLL